MSSASSIARSDQGARGPAPSNSCVDRSAPAVVERTPASGSSRRARVGGQLEMRDRQLGTGRPPARAPTRADRASPPSSRGRTGRCRRRARSAGARRARRRRASGRTATRPRAPLRGAGDHRVHRTRAWLDAAPPASEKLSAMAVGKCSRSSSNVSTLRNTWKSGVRLASRAGARSARSSSNGTS